MILYAALDPAIASRASQGDFVKRRFSRCEIDSHSSRSASTFSRNMNALCEVIFRPISPRATPLLRGHHLIIASRGLAELPGRRV